MVKPAIKTAVVCFITAHLFSCVIINQGLNRRNTVAAIPGTAGESIETQLSRFPLLVNNGWYSNSLHLTVLNPKKKTVADIYLTSDSTANYPFSNNSFLFKLDVRDFAKTTVTTATLNCPFYLVSALNITKSEDGYYKISSKDTDSLNSCLVRGTAVPADRNEVLYNYTGKLINEYGTEVSYYGQGDPPPLKLVYAALVIASTASETLHYVTDICNTAKTIENAKRNAPCNNPQVKIEYFPRPLAKIFYKPVYPDFYRDCRAIVLCPKN